LISESRSEFKNLNENLTNNCFGIRMVHMRKCALSNPSLIGRWVQHKRNKERHRENPFEDIASHMLLMSYQTRLRESFALKDGIDSRQAGVSQPRELGC
jgi:hypothetical protein